MFVSEGGWAMRIVRASAVASFLSAAACLAAIDDAAARTLEQIKAVGALSMCANPDALPYSSNKPDLPGFQIQIGRAIAQGLGLPLRIDWIVPRRRVAEANCDMLLDNVNDPDLRTPDRLLSIPYQRTGIALALGPTAEGATGLGDLQKTQKVGVMVGSLASVILGRRGLSISPYAFQDEMLEDLESGVLTAAAVSSANLSYYVKRHPGGNLRMVNLLDSEPDLEWTVSAGLRRADDALLIEVNRTIAALLLDGTIPRIYAQYGIEYRAP